MFSYSHVVASSLLRGFSGGRIPKRLVQTYTLLTPDSQLLAKQITLEDAKTHLKNGQSFQRIKNKENLLLRIVDTERYEEEEKIRMRMERELEKARRKNKTKMSQNAKQILITTVTTTHDADIKAKQAQAHLTKGEACKFVIYNKPNSVRNAPPEWMMPERLFEKYFYSLGKMRNLVYNEAKMTIEFEVIPNEKKSSLQTQRLAKLKHELTTLRKEQKAKESSG